MAVPVLKFLILLCDTGREIASQPPGGKPKSTQVEPAAPLERFETPPNFDLMTSWKIET